MDRGQGAAETAGEGRGWKEAGHAAGTKERGQAAASANLMMYKGKLLGIAVHACIVGYKGRHMSKDRGGRPSWL